MGVVVVGVGAVVLVVAVVEMGVCAFGAYLRQLASLVMLEVVGVVVVVVVGLVVVLVVGLVVVVVVGLVLPLVIVVGT